MQKLGNIFKGNKIVITQSPHGSWQNYKSMDLINYESFDLIAPIDGEIPSKGIYQAGFQSGFHFVFGDYDILFHHCNVKRAGFFKKGEVIGNWMHKSGDLHVHTAIRVGGVWDVLLSYMDRDLQLLPTTGKPKNKWHKWPTYPDKYIILNDTDMVQIKFGAGVDDRLAEKLIITATTLNVRQYPSTSAPVVAQLTKGDVTVPSTFAKGEIVDGNDAWARHKSGGWYSLRWAERVEGNDCSGLEKELEQKEAEIAKLQTEAGEMEEDLGKINEITNKYIQND